MDELNNFIRIVFNNNERSRHFTLLYTINNLLIINDDIYKKFTEEVANSINLFNFIENYSHINSELLKYLNNNSIDFNNFQNEFINLFEHINNLIIKKDDISFTTILDKYWAQILNNYNKKSFFKKYVDFFIKIKELLKERDKKILCDFKKKYTYFELDTKTNFIDISLWLKMQIKSKWKELKESHEEIDLQKTEKYYSNSKSTKYLYKLENNYYLFDKKTKVKTIIKNFNYDKLGLNNLNSELFKNILTKQKNEVIDLLNKNINESILEDSINPILVYTLLNKLNIPIIKDQYDNFKFIKFEKWEKINKQYLSLNLKKYLTFCINYFNEFNFNLLISQSYNSIDKYLKEKNTFDIEEEQVKVLISNISKSYLLKHLNLAQTVPDLIRQIYKSHNIKLPIYLSQNGGYFDFNTIKNEQKLYNYGSILYEKIYNNIGDLFPKDYIIKLKDEYGNFEEVTYEIYLNNLNDEINIIKGLEGFIYGYLEFYFQIQEYLHLFDIYGFEKISGTIYGGLQVNFNKLIEKLKLKEKEINSLLTFIGNNNDNNLINTFSL